QAGPGGDGQLTDEQIRVHQRADKTVRKLKEAGRYGDRRIEEVGEIVYIRAEDGGRRVVLPSTLWVKVLREAHDSIFACHLRTPQTYARISAVYWWPDMRMHVRQWVQACRDCGTRKTKAKEVIPPLRSQGVGAVGDRWAIDVAGPLPVTANGNRYVVAAVDYATRYAVVATVADHTASAIAKFIVEKLVLIYGPMRELVMDGAPEFNGRVVEELVSMLQARQVTPVPYRPALLGLVERFHRTWKDMVAIFVGEAQNDWDRWVHCAVYAYNGARHSGTGYTPNELMMGRRLRSPNELLRASEVTQVGQFAEYHRKLVDHMASATTSAKAALARDQKRREKFYNRRGSRHHQAGSSMVGASTD
ncbi:Cyclic AMP-dependent protein kinase, partial [Phytophthora megakarya]